MRISTFWYCFKQGIINICRNIWFSLASTAIISACIFLFCVFFSVITNVQHMVVAAESQMGITVFFEEELSGDEILAIGECIESEKGIKNDEKKGGKRRILKNFKKIELDHCKTGAGKRKWTIFWNYKV